MGSLLCTAVRSCPADRAGRRRVFGMRAVRRAALIVLSILAVLLPARAAFAATLELDRLIQTSPFVSTSVSIGDNEGSAFVPSDQVTRMIAPDLDTALAEIASRVEGQREYVVGR